MTPDPLPRFAVTLAPRTPAEAAAVRAQIADIKARIAIEEAIRARLEEPRSQDYETPREGAYRVSYAQHQRTQAVMAAYEHFDVRIAMEAR